MRDLDAVGEQWFNIATVPIWETLEAGTVSGPRSDTKVITIAILDTLEKRSVRR